MQVRGRLKKFIVYSILWHLIVVGALLVTSYVQNSNKQTEKIEISFLTPEDLTPQKKLSEPKSVVETDSAEANEKISEKAQFLSEKNNTVAKETRAKTGMKFLNSKQAATQKAQPPQKSAREQIKRDLFSNNYDAYAAISKKMQREEEKKELLAKSIRSPAAALRDRNNSDPSTTNDSLKNVKDDLMTRLNTREYKYYGYYNRIKTQLNQWWVPKVQQKFTKMISQGRTIASDENKVTKLVIVLNDVGNLVKVQVLGASGVRDLDEAAIEAFRQAAPFPNPPKGMLESDGTVKIRWDCVVES